MSAAWQAAVLATGQMPQKERCGVKAKVAIPLSNPHSLSRPLISPCLKVQGGCGVSTPGEIRTPDRMVRSHVLCPLSYGGMEEGFDALHKYYEF